MSTLCLSFHRDYGCRHRGACCTSQWPIPVEADRLAAMRVAIASGALRRADNSSGDPFIHVDGAPADAPAVLATTSQGCAFYRGNGLGRCEVHRALGHAALPLACRQFPRVVIRDPRGVSVTLSHYCPTAAALLDSTDAVSITDQAPAFPSSAEYVGFDATGALPPLLRRDMLMDWSAWWEIERRTVEWIGHSGSCCRDAVDRLTPILERIRSWRPADGPLVDCVTAAFEETSADPVPTADATRRHGVHLTRLQDVAAGIPVEWIAQTPRAFREPIGPIAPAPERDAATRRYVAAHAFASWTAHIGQGLRTWWRSIDAALILIESGLDVREGDLVLRHLADPDALARVWSRSEEA